MENKKHLPMYGVGSVYVAVIIAATAAPVIAGHNVFFESGLIKELKTPSVITGILLIIFGLYLWHGAVFCARVDDGITDGRAQ